MFTVQIVKELLSFPKYQLIFWAMGAAYTYHMFSVGGGGSLVYSDGDSGKEFEEAMLTVG